MKAHRKSTIVLTSLMTILLVGCKGRTFARPTTSSSEQDISQNAKPNDSSDLESSESSESISSKTEDTVISSVRNVSPSYSGMKILNPLSNPKKDDSGLDSNDIEKIITTFPKVEQGDKADFFVNPSSVMKVQVLIDNIKDISISSVNINSTIYDSTKFEVNEEGIVVEIQSKKEPGYFSLELKNISYYDAENHISVFQPTKDETIKLAASYEEIPTAELISKKVDLDSISFAVKVNHAVSMPTASKVIAYLTDGVKKVGEQEVNIGEQTTITFSNLDFDTEYQVGIAASFDLFDGQGLHYGWILKEKIKTPSPYSFKDVVASKSGVVFSIAKEFESEKATVSSIDLKDGDKLVSQITGSELQETNSFTDLLSNHAYKLVLNFQIGEKVFFKDYDIKTIAINEPTVSTKITKIDKSSFTYQNTITDEDSVLVLDNLELKDENNKLVKELDVTKLTDTVSDLYANSKYFLILKYHFDLNDGKGEQKLESSISITTESYTIPNLQVSATADETSINYSLEAVLGKDENPLIVDYVELLDGDSVALDKDGKAYRNEDGLMSGTFEGLFSNQNYSIRAGYHYDMHDGKGEEGNGIYSVTTQKLDQKTKAMPDPDVSLTNKETDIGYDFISGELAIDQFYEGMVHDVKLELSAEDGTVLNTTNGSTFKFEGLDSLTRYKIKYSYKYSLNAKDGADIEKTGVYSFKTAPEFRVSNFRFPDNDVIEAGDNIDVCFNFENPKTKQLEITEIRINGVSYSTLSSETIEAGSKDGEIRLNIDSTKLIDNESGGETKITLESVTLVDHGDNNQRYICAFDKDNSITKMIYGNCYVENIDFVDKNGKAVDYFTDKDDAYCMVTIHNKNDYDVTSLMVNGKQISLTKENRVDQDDPTKYRFKYIPSQAGFFTLNIQQINYQKDNYVRSLKQNTCFTSSMYLVDPTINHISSVAQFFDMDGGSNTINILDNDLDFKNIKYKSMTYNGVFDGQGHSIKNYGRRETFRNESSVSGLFETGNMVLTKLKLESAYYSVKLININESTVQNGVLGGFIGKSDSSIISNCYVDEYSSFRLENQTKKNPGTMSGSLAGYLGGNSKVKNCYNEGVVLSDGYVGGLVGRLDGRMDSCYNVGNIRSISAESLGGLIGLSSPSPKFGLSNSVNLGPDRNYYTRKMGAVGEISYTLQYDENCKNNYNLAKLYLSSADKKTSTKSLDRSNITSDFFKTTLGWSDVVWDMSNVNSTNKIYPTLKVFHK